jgi:hypothetical protein
MSFGASCAHTLMEDGGVKRRHDHVVTEQLPGCAEGMRQPRSLDVSIPTLASCSAASSACESTMGLGRQLRSQTNY